MPRAASQFGHAGGIEPAVPFAAVIGVQQGMEAEIGDLAQRLRIGERRAGDREQRGG